MSTALAPCAVVAEDEPVLARTLLRLLHQAWPELRIAGVASDGLQAVDLALEHTPQVLFLDIKMPGRNGLDVAQAVVDDWPDGRPVPLIVFITAFDEFAVAAFERAAVDYVLKPATAERLAVTVERLQRRLLEQAPDLDAVFVNSDLMAIGAINVIQNSGKRVPEDIAVVGYDDLSIANYNNLPLTTVRQNIPLAGKLLAQNLIQYIQTGVVTHVTIPVELVVRKSA